VLATANPYAQKMRRVSGPVREYPAASAWRPAGEILATLVELPPIYTLDFLRSRILILGFGEVFPGQFPLGQTGTGLDRTPPGTGAKVYFATRVNTRRTDARAIPTSLAISEAIEARGAILLYVPPYSPDLNPIEQFFSKLKAILRKAVARSTKYLWAVIGSCLKDFSQSGCAASPQRRIWSTSSQNGLKSRCQPFCNGLCA